MYFLMSSSTAVVPCFSGLITLAVAEPKSHSTKLPFSDCRMFSTCLEFHARAKLNSQTSTHPNTNYED